MFVLIVTLITLVASYSIDTSYSYDYLGQYNDDGALDCSNKNKRCENKIVDLNIENCDEWYVDEPLEELKCNMTSDGIEHLSLIADPANYVTGKFTEENI